VTILDQRDLIGDASSDSAAWVDEGGGTAPTTYTLSAPPGVTTVISDKVSNQLDGMLYNDATPAGGAYADGDTIFIWWNAIFGSFNTVANGGVRMKFAGATRTDFFAVTIGGSDSGKSGWQLTAVNIGKARANPDFVGGTPPAAASIEHVGILWDVTANVGGNNDNCAIGNIYRQTADQRTYRIDAGTDGTPITWQDVADQVLTDGTGIVQVDSNGVFRLAGSFAWGTSTPSSAVDMTFVDAGVVLAFEDFPFIEDSFYQFEMDLAASYTGDARITAGAKSGAGAAAVGVNGWTILTGGPKWRWIMEDADQTDVQLYGCAFSGAGDCLLDDPAVECVSNTWIGCGTVEVTGNSVAASMPRWVRNFFSACPGPRAQIVWTNAVSPNADGFQFNTFANMLWFGMEIGSAMTGSLTFELRDNAFTNNGTNRDILASNDVGDLTINSDASPTPQGTNGTTINIAMVGTVDRFIYTVVTYEDVSNTDGADQSAFGNPLVTQLTASLSADDDTFAVAAAVPFGALTYTGASDQYTDDLLFENIVGGLVARLGLDEVTPGAATRTGFPVHDGTETEGVQAIVNVNEFATSTPVGKIDPAFRPWAEVVAGISATFGYGAALAAVHANTKCFVIVIALDAATAADTAISAIDIDTGASVQALTSRIVEQDDNIGGAGNSLELSIFDLHEAVDTTEQGGTLLIQAGSVATLIHVADDLGVDLENAIVLLEAADAAGDLPFDDTVTITHVTTLATVAHTGHDMIAGDKVVIRKADQNPYNGTFAISNISANAYDYTMNSDPGENATGTIKATGAVLQGLTDANGDITTSRSWGSNQNVRGYVRKSTTSPRFKTFDLSGNTISSADGLPINVRMQLNE